MLRWPLSGSVVLFALCSAPLAAQEPWALKSPAVSPTARTGHAMAYDAAHQQVVLFGGREQPQRHVGLGRNELDSTESSQQPDRPK